jgi:glycosyltransferase 2 family protein
VSEYYSSTNLRLRKFLNSLRSKGNALIITLLFGLLVVIILGFLIYREREILLTYDWQFHPTRLLISFLLFSLDLFIVAKVWAWIMDTLGKKLSFLKHFCYFTLSNIAKRIPGTIWYIASRTQLYRQEGIDPKLSSLASGMEMAVSVLSSVIVCTIFAIPVIIFYEVNPILLAIVFLISVIVIHPRFMAWIFRLLKVEAAPFNYIDILQWLVTYTFAWILGGILMFSIGNSITSIALRDLPYIIGSFGLVNLVTMAFFFLPSNVGITELGWSVLLSNIMPLSVAVVLAISMRLLIILYEIIWAAISYIIINRKKMLINPK